jgi:hypothetical protein
MDSQIKKEWLEALRAGKYKQCRRAFRPCPESLGAKQYGEDSYCCLAVLSDIYINKVGDMRWDKNLLVDNEDIVDAARVYDWAGLSPDDATKCVKLNDVDGYTFEQIADYIEGNF